MTPEQAISSLDRALSRNGELAILQRPIGNNQAWLSVEVNAQVLGYQPHELVAGSGIVQGDSKVIISPTQINAAQWPGGYVADAQHQGDQRIPIKFDRMMIAGRPRAVQAATPRYLAGELVRIEVQVR